MKDDKSSKPLPSIQRYMWDPRDDMPSESSPSSKVDGVKIRALAALFDTESNKKINDVLRMIGYNDEDLVCLVSRRPELALLRVQKLSNILGKISQV